MDILIIIIAGLYTARILISHLLTWIYFSRYDLLYPPGEFTPDVSIIKPLKGIDENDYENFKSFCEQQYNGKYEILFCVEIDTDPVIPVIKKLISEYPEKDIKLINSDLYSNHKGKIKNMIAGVIVSKYNTLLFTDADVSVLPLFINSVVTPLKNKKTGLAFCPPISEKAGNWPAALLNILINDYIINYVPYFTFNPLRMANGAIMATRKEIIDEIGGLEQFHGSIADDVELAGAIHKKGYRIHFIKYPARMIHQLDTFSKCWSQIHRWLVILKQYSPVGILLYCLSDIPVFWCLVYLVYCLFIPGSFFIGFTVLIGTILFQFISKSIINIKIAKDKCFWKFLWIIPFLDIIKFPLILHSYISNKVIWRGRKMIIKKKHIIK